MTNNSESLTTMIVWVFATLLLVWFEVASAATTFLHVDGSPGIDTAIASNLDSQDKDKKKSKGKSGNDKDEKVEAVTTEKQSGSQKQKKRRDDQQATPAKSSLTVNVLDGNSGSKISGAQVKISGKAQSSARTDSRGAATFTDLDRGMISISVSADGWISLEKSLRLDEESEKILLSLSPLETQLTVEVIGVEDDRSEVSVADCIVKVSVKGRSIEKRTDKSGTAVFAKLARGEIRVNVIAKKWETGYETKTLSSNEEKVAIRVARRHPPEQDDPNP